MPTSAFQVKIRHHGQPADARVRFLVTGEESFLAQWERFLDENETSLPNPTASKDSVHLASLAVDRWQQTKGLVKYAPDIEQINRWITDTSDEEICGIAGMEYPGFEGLIGVCHFHRTWTHNLFIDFLATHPALVASDTSPIKGIGLASTYFLATVANMLNCSYIWGETTPLSLPFYQKIFKLELAKTDMIRLEQDVYKQVLSSFNKLYSK